MAKIIQLCDLEWLIFVIFSKQWIHGICYLNALIFPFWTNILNKKYLLRRFLNVSCDTVWLKLQIPRPLSGELIFSWLIPQTLPCVMVTINQGWWWTTRNRSLKVSWLIVWNQVAKFLVSPQYLQAPRYAAEPL